ncbi:MAG TPA: hypothetical protein VE134_06800 [Methanomicrobiales archaeon]|nr:hypothetical protein [Methanomicrobiales archaeon]
MNFHTIADTIKNFHIVTKAVIALVGLLFGLTIISVALALAGYMGSGPTLIMTSLYLFAYVAIGLALVFMVIMAVKQWIEKYLDAMVQKQNVPPEVNANVQALQASIQRLETKLDKIENILEKVSE